MLYDIRLHLHYTYAAAAGGSRHHVIVAPQTIGGVQRVVASSLSFSPTPTERSPDFVDFFGNAVTSVAFRGSYETLDMRMSARVSVARPEPGLDVSPALANLGEEIASVRSLSPASAASFPGRQRFCRPRPRHHRLCAREPVANLVGDRHRQRFLQPHL